MSQQTVIDCQRFALENGVQEGSLAVKALDRLHDQLSDTSGDLTYRLEGAYGERGQICLSLQVTGMLQLVCQRCMGPMAFEVDIDSHLEMLPDGAEVTQEELEDDSKDYLPWEKMLDVSALVEDEVILALPVAARHEECDLQGRAEAGENLSPFAALASLKSGLN